MRILKWLKERRNHDHNGEFSLMIYEDPSDRFPSPVRRLGSAFRRMFSSANVVRDSQPLPANELVRELKTRLRSKRVSELTISPVSPDEIAVFLQMTVSTEDIRVKVWGTSALSPAIQAIATGLARHNVESDMCRGNEYEQLLSATFYGEQKVDKASDFCERVFTELLGEDMFCRISC